MKEPGRNPEVGITALKIFLFLDRLAGVCAVVQLVASGVAEGRWLTLQAEQQVLRIIDANLNRVREGLRVIEEVARFLLDDAELTARLKQFRHHLSEAAGGLAISTEELVGARNADGDVGADLYPDTEGHRPNVFSVIEANIKRLQEGARVLEEFSKIFSSEAGKQFKALRFASYTLEKTLLTKCKEKGITNE